MGEVYLGVHEKLGRPAAIKILGAAAQDDSFKTRFFNEARVQASLHHPNIATLYDFQQQGDELLIFMEYVDGESLDEIVASRTFGVDEALGIFRSICEAVGYMHSNGVVHRDIKAQNIKLTAGGSVKLLDFGIAKEETSHGLTQTGGIIGTPSYLSPEQLKGGKAGPQTDVWALGVLLYEMLTGKMPFEGDSIGGLVLKITTEPFTPPERHNPSVPREVSRIVDKCLKKDASSRYRTVGDLIAAASSIRGRTDREAANPSPGTTRDLAPSRPFPLAIVAAVGGAAVILVFLIVGIAFWALGGDAVAANVTANVAAKTSNAPKPSPGGSSQRVRVDVDEGKAEVMRDGAVVGITPLDMDVPAGEKPKLTLHRDGFEDKSVQLDELNSGKKVFTFSLRRKN